VFLAADGCFKAHRLKKKGQIIDPEAYNIDHFIVSEAEIKLCLAQATRNNSTAHDSQCSDFAATSNRRMGPDFDETGIFGLCCARHETPLIACNMFSGDRFVYLDKLLNMIATKSMHPNDDRQIYLGYDVACKYIAHVKVFSNNNRIIL
jgi:Kyakuja-Dileera-Zisupton transposase